MIAYDEIQITLDLEERLNLYIDQVNSFRKEGPLDAIALAKLEEAFRASHIYNSAGIEGNRLTLQETALVLSDGIDISGKPIKDTVEVRNLAVAFDYLKTLAESEQTVRETDIRSLHSLLVGDDLRASPGEYRKIGVIISGSEHRPPEPLEVPIRMEALVRWVNTNMNQNPIIVAAIAHHELTSIHPFVDGNGRVSRLMMNLILLRHGFPICNVRRDERPAYYEALSFADIGLYDSLIQLTMSRSADLFGEYVRIRSETKRMAEWAQKWGTNATRVLVQRETREMELWLSRIRQILLEFQKAAELLDDQLGNIVDIEFYEYANEITFEKYQQLVDEGKIPQANSFSITFTERQDENQHRFMFRYYRNFQKFPKQSSIIPLELNYFDKTQNRYVRLSDLGWTTRIRLRDLYFTQEGAFAVRYYDIAQDKETEKKGGTIAEAVEWFFDDILKNVIGLT